MIFPSEIEEIIQTTKGIQIGDLVIFSCQKEKALQLGKVKNCFRSADSKFLYTITTLIPKTPMVSGNTLYFSNGKISLFVPKNKIEILGEEKILELFLQITERYQKCQKQT